MTQDALSEHRPLTAHALELCHERLPSLGAQMFTKL